MLKPLYQQLSSLWNMIQQITNSMAPMGEVLWLADGVQPSMGDTYNSMIQLLHSIHEREAKHSENVHTANEEINDKRMKFSKQPVYRAAYTLNHATVPMSLTLRFLMI